MWGRIHYHIAKDLPRRVQLRSVEKPDIGEKLIRALLTNVICEYKGAIASPDVVRELEGASCISVSDAG